MLVQNLLKQNKQKAILGGDEMGSLRMLKYFAIFNFHATYTFGPKYATRKRRIFISFMSKCISYIKTDKIQEST